MFLLFWVLWVVFNGKLDLEVAILGVVISLAVFAFMCKFGDYSIKREKKLIKNSFRLLRYVRNLVFEVAKANFAVMRLILSEKEEVEPALVNFKSELKSPVTQALLANAITLTPGTITVLLEHDTYTVHCLDKDFSEGINESVFVEILTEIDKE